MICPICNSEVRDGMSYCPNCGKEMSKIRFCSFCGSKLREKMRFFSNCDFPLYEIVKTKNMTKKRFKAFCSWSFISILLILGTVSYFLIKNKRARIEAENKPSNKFYKIASTGRYVWQCDVYQFYFGVGETTLLYFYPTNEGGGRITYLNVLKDYSGYYNGFSTTGVYSISENFITSTVKGINGLGGTWSRTLNLVVENDGEEIKLRRLLNNGNEVGYHQIPVPMVDPYPISRK